MSDDLTEIYGTRFESERVDTGIYQTIRTIQFLGLYSFRLKPLDNLDIEEERAEKDGKVSFVYTLKNHLNGLKGYVGRDPNKNNITFLFLDQSRIKWMRAEGFEISDETCAAVGTIGQLKGMNCLLNFLAGKRDFEIVGYCRAPAKPDIL